MINGEFLYLHRPDFRSKFILPLGVQNLFCIGPIGAVFLDQVGLV